MAKYFFIIFLLTACVIVNKSKDVKIDHRPGASPELIINEVDSIK